MTTFVHQPFGLSGNLGRSSTTLTKCRSFGCPGVISLRPSMKRSLPTLRACCHVVAGGFEDKLTLLETGRKLYVDVWTEGNLDVLDDIMASDHLHFDRCWRPDEEVLTRRDALKDGIKRFRTYYPNIGFTVDKAAEAATGNKVFLQWVAEGVSSKTGSPMKTMGVTVLSFNKEGKIQQSDVYRQATAGEWAAVGKARLEARSSTP